MAAHHLVIETIEAWSSIKTLAGIPNKVNGSPRFWLVNLEEQEEDYALLAPPEMHQSSLLERAEARRHFATRIGVLRSILSRLTGQPAAALNLRKGVYGKPYIIDGPAFNTSYSEHWLLVGVSEMLPIGVDIEAIRHLPDFDSVANYSLTQTEKQQLRTIPQSKRLEAFYTFWTIKEAILKASGYGLNLPLTDISVQINTSLEPTKVELAGSTAGAFKLRYLATATHHGCRLAAAILDE